MRRKVGIAITWMIAMLCGLLQVPTVFAESEVSVEGMVSDKEETSQISEDNPDSFNDQEDIQSQQTKSAYSEVNVEYGLGFAESALPLIKTIKYRFDEKDLTDYANRSFFDSAQELAKDPEEEGFTIRDTVPIATNSAGKVLYVMVELKNSGLINAWEESDFYLEDEIDESIRPGVLSSPTSVMNLDESVFFMKKQFVRGSEELELDYYDPEDYFYYRPISFDVIGMDPVKINLNVGEGYEIVGQLYADTVDWGDELHVSAEEKHGAGIVNVIGASVDKNGRISISINAKKEGSDELVFMITSGEYYSSSFPVQVSVSKSSDSISLSEPSLALRIGESETLVVSNKMGPVDSSQVEWQSSDSMVASVSGGVVRGVDRGVAIISAKTGEKMVSCSVTVSGDFTPIEDLSDFRLYKAIHNREELEALRNNNSHGYYYLANDIDLGNEEWIPIGYSGKAEPDYSFQGILDGQGHKISGMKCYGLAGGLFYTLGSSTIIRNLTLDNVFIDSGTEVNHFNGAFVGNCYGAEFRNLYVSGIIIGGYSRGGKGGIGSVGGIIGEGNGNTIIDCCNAAMIEGQHGSSGGIISRSSGDRIERCENRGTITATGGVGGIVGETYGSTIKDCTNCGVINGDGGIVGNAHLSYLNGNMIIDKCVNYANINGITVGGIVGSFSVNTGYSGTTYDAGIIDCTNYGHVTGTTYAGGIVGSSVEKIVGCTNYGQVDGDKGGGGILGSASYACSVKDCINKGDITGELSGGIAGHAGANYRSYEGYRVYQFSAYNCINEGTVSASGYYSASGGIVGEMYFAGIISDCRNNGEVFGDNRSAGIVAVLRAKTYQSDSDKENEEENTMICNTDNNGTIHNGSGIVGFIDFYEDYDKQYYINSKISNCNNYGMIIDDDSSYMEYFGGILGEVEEQHTSFFDNSDPVSGVIQIEHCSNYADLTMEGRYIGGIIGYGDRRVEIIDCNNYGMIRSEGGAAAGIAMLYTKLISGCSNYGRIIGISSGGIGGSGNLKIEKCWNKGFISGTESAGGITNRANEIVKCVNEGDVEARDACGIANSVVEIADCYNTGNIKGEKSAGGIANSYSSEPKEIRNTYSIGTVYSGPAGKGIIQAGGIASKGGDLKIVSSVALESSIRADWTAGYWSDDENYASMDVIAIGGFNSLFENNLYRSDLLNIENDDRARAPGQFYLRSTYEGIGWDFNETWEIAPGGGLPVLRWQKLSVGPQMAPIDGNSILLNRTKLYLTVGATRTLVASLPSETDPTFLWESSNSSIVTVSEKGEIHALKGGTAIITVKSGMYSAKCEVVVASSTPLDLQENNLDPFLIEPEHYDNNLAKICADLSLKAYEDSGLKDYLSNQLGFNSDFNANIESRNYGTSLAFTVAKRKYTGKDADEIIVITTQGSTTVYELVKDVTASSSVKFKGLDGTYMAYDIVVDFCNEILDTMNTLVRPGKKYKVMLTGHSLGGAAVNLLAAHLIQNAEKDNYHFEVFCYTFGAVNSINRDSCVLEGYEGIHNVYNFMDTFSPYQYGGYLWTWMGRGFGKFGQMEPFVHDYRNLIQMSLPPLTQIAVHTNHDMDKYVEAVRNGLILNSPLRKGNISIIGCPVDIDVYCEGELVGRVIQNEVDKTHTTIDIKVENDVKFIFYPDNKQYEIRMSAFDSGNMVFSMLNIEANETKLMTDVSLFAGKEMFSEAGGEIGLDETQLLVVGTDNELISKIEEDGTEIPISMEEMSYSCSEIINTGKSVDFSAIINNFTPEEGNCNAIAALYSDGRMIEAKMKKDVRIPINREIREKFSLEYPEAYKGDEVGKMMVKLFFLSTDNLAPLTKCVPCIVPVLEGDESQVSPGEVLSDSAGVKIEIEDAVNGKEQLLFAVLGSYSVFSEVPEDIFEDELLYIDQQTPETDVVTFYVLPKSTTQSMTVFLSGNEDGQPKKIKEISNAEQEVTVTFDSLGGSFVPASRLGKGQKTEKPEDPVRDGYTFMGWYKEDEYITPWKFETDTVEDDMILYAKWIDEKSGDDGEILPEDIHSTGIPDSIWTAGIKDVNFTGQTVTPSFRVYDGNKRLTEKTDYTVSVKNNKNAYELENVSSPTQTDIKKAPRVEISFKGSYKGKKIVYFSILKPDISGDEFDAPEVTLTWSGKALKVKPALYQNETAINQSIMALKQNKDFTMSALSPKDPGTYETVLTGIGNYKGTRKLTVTVTKDVKQVSMEDAKVTGIKNQNYSGASIRPSGFTVKYGRDTLTEGTDYTVSYGENISAGTGTIILTGTGTANSAGVSFHGTKRISFKIAGVPLSKVSVVGLSASLPYTGERITQAIKLTHSSFGELKEGTDYASPVYTNNLNAGTATVSIKGLGGFTGTVKKTFKITKLDLSKAEMTIGTAFHTKGGSKPSVSVSLGGKTLIRDTDYTVSYKNNGKQTSSASASATIKGKGNYQGSQTKSFMISAKSLTAENGLKLVAADKVATGKKNGWSQSFKVYDTDGKALAVKKDYDNASYSIVSGMLNGESVSAEKALTKDDIVGAGSVIRISVDGKGDYAGGTLSGTYRILAAGCDISKATFRINDQVYPGKGGSVSIISAAQIGKAELKQGSGTTSLAFGSDFEVVEGSLENNRKTGTAKVTFRGMGKYGGTKTVSFKITAKMASD